LATSGSFLQRLVDQAQHLARLGMSAEGGFGEHQLVVHGNFEASAGRRSQFERPQPDLMQLQKLGRQTDGPIGVVSGDAVFDTDHVHRNSASGWEYTASRRHLRNRSPSPRPGDFGRPGLV